jgi:hypothetical protein
VLTDAIVPELLLQLPPAVASLRDVVVPTHIPRLPDIGAGDTFTVTTAVLVQPVPSEYVIVAVFGPRIPVTSPDAPTVAMVGSLLVHTPPAGVLTSDVVEPSHTVIVPVIADGAVVTVAIAVL